MPEFTIFVNNKPLRTSEHSLTGNQLKQLAGVPSDNELFVEVGKETRAIGPDEVVHLHEGQRFRAIPPGTFGATVASTKA